MNKRIISYLFSAGMMLVAMSACGSYANYHDKPVEIPAESGYEQAGRRVNPGAVRRGPVTRTAVPATPYRPSPRPVPSAPVRVVPGSGARPQGEVIHVPDPQNNFHGGNPYGPAPQAIQPIPPEPVQIEAPTHPPARAASEANKGAIPASPSAASVNPGTAGLELASHKTEFDPKDEGRANNITRASASINGKVVQPGETFSYNETVGPTIERRGYKEGVIFVEGEKKKGFGGGVCQVSTTLSIAADKAGMTIIERHDHSLPVSYAKEGEEAATSYGGLDFKFKNELDFPVVIHSSVEGGSVTVKMCKG